MAVRATVAMIATTTIATAAAPVFISGFDERSAASVAGAIGGPSAEQPSMGGPNGRPFCAAALLSFFWQCDHAALGSRRVTVAMNCARASGSARPRGSNT